MHVEVLTEESSAEAALQVLLPRILGADATFAVHPFVGKQSLLSRLPGRLRGYAAWLPPDWRLVVLVDRDNDDCTELKRQLEDTAAEAGLLTPSRCKARDQVRVLNRIAVEELEAWFFGDPTAITTAYPRVSAHLGKRAKYRNPDSIPGGTWEALERVLQKAGYYKAGLLKKEVAGRIAAHMDPTRNVSRSFQAFRDGLRALRLAEEV